MSPRVLSPIILLALSGVFGLPWGCQRDEAHTDGPDPDENLNVVLISLDTTRADRLGCYGFEDVHTPNIDRLAAEGTTFEQCSATAPITLPSHASMLTGLYPFVHGARDNGRFKLDEANITVAEILADNGYHTAAQVAVYVIGRTTGMAQGFEVFRDTGDIERTDKLTPSQRAARAGRSSPLNELRGDLAADGAIALLREASGGPFFLFAHLFDPHQPYEPPEPFLSQYNDPYLGEIAYVDSQVGRILDEIDRLGLLERTLVVLTADHGEAFHEHGVTGHSYFIYDTTIHVPLIMRLPGSIPAGKRIAHQVRIIDIAPTILDFTGLHSLAVMQGESLRRYFGTDPIDLGLSAYMETLSPHLDFGYSRLRGLRNDRWKYIHAPRKELYDIQADPGETNNVYLAHQDLAARMKRAMEDLIQSSAPVTSNDDSQVDMSDEEIERLQSLGYVGGDVESSGDRHEHESLELVGADPKDRIEQIRKGTAAIWHSYRKNHAQAERIYRELLLVDRENPVLLRRLADSLASQGRSTQAIQALREVVRLSPEKANAHERLGDLLIAMGDAETGLKHLERVTQLRPRNARVFAKYGKELMRQNQRQNATLALQQALALDPKQIEAAVNLATLSVLDSRYKRAAALFKATLKLDPSVQFARLQLAWLRATCPDDAVRDGASAVEIAQRAAKGASQSDQKVLNVLAAALAEAGEFKRAVDVAKTAKQLADRSGDLRLSTELKKRIALYRQKRPLRSGQLAE